MEIVLTRPSESLFGFFEGVQKKRFNGGYAGRFRVARGALQPFGLYLMYDGKDSFADFQPFILNLQQRSALNLEPLGFWDFCPQHASSDEQHFYFFDSQRNGGFDFKATGYECTVRTEQQTSYLQLAKVLTEWKVKDPIIENLHLESLVEPE